MAFDSSIKVGIAIGATVAAGVGRAFESVADRTRRVGATLERVNKHADRHRQELRRLRAEQARTGDGSREIARRIEAVGEALRRTTARARRYREELRRGQGLERARAGRDRALRQGAVALGGAYALSRLVTGSFDRERAELRLGSLLAGPTREADLGRAVAHSRTDVRQGRVLQGEAELLQVQADLRGADLSAEVARIGSTLSAKIATVTQGTAREVASVLGSAYTLNAAQFEGDTQAVLGQIGELLTATQKKYKFEVFSDLGQGLVEVAAGASSAKLSLDQQAVALGLLSKVDLAGGRGGTALNAVLRQLPRAAEDLGASVVRFDDDSLDLVSTLQQLQARLAAIRDTDARSQVIQKRFGEEGARGVVPLLDQLGQLESDLRDIKNPIETIDEAHQRWLDSASGKAAILRNNLAGLRDTMAAGLLPAVEPVVGATQSLAIWIGRVAEEAPAVGSAMRLAAGAVGGFVAVSLGARGGRYVWLLAGEGFRTVVDVAGAARRGVGMTAGAMGRYGAALGRVTRIARAATVVQWLWNAALLANPIGLTVAAVVAAAALIGGAAYLIYKHWEPIKDFFAGLWEWVVDAAKGVGLAIVDAIAGGLGAGPLVRAVGSMFGKVWNLMAESDAREGPLSNLTRSGGSILPTIGEGVRRAGPGGLQRPLRSQLAAATAGLALAVAPAAVEAVAPALPAAAEPRQAGTVNNYYSITVNAAPGEDVRSLARRLMDEIERQQGVRDRRALRDDL